MRTSFAVAAVLFAFVAEGQLTFKPMPAKLIVDPQTHTASGVIVITNDSVSAAPVLLMADDFVADGKVVGMGAKVLFGLNDEVPAKGELPLTVPAKGHARVRIDVSRLTHAGIARSQLMNYTTRVADLEAVKAHVPFNVVPVGSSGDAPLPLRFDGELGPRLHLKNDDPYDYIGRWSLSTDGVPKKKEGKFVIFAQSSEVLPVSADDWRPPKGDFASLLKNRESSGTLELVATDQSGKQVWKRRSIPVVVHRSYWSATQQAWRAFAVLALLVLAGGVASILVTHWVPNRLRRIAVRDLIMAVTPKIRAITTAVESNLRTGVRVERTRLLQRLRTRSTISPDFGELARTVEAAARRLDREVDILDKIDSKMRQIETSWPTAGVHGPTLLQRACVLLSEAQAALDRPDINDDVVAAAATSVQKAEATIENATTIDESSKTAIRDRLAALQKSQQLLTCDVAKKITEGVPRLTAALKLKADELVDANFSQYDEDTAKLELVRRFVELCEKVENKNEKQNCVEAFIVALRRGGFHDFRTAEMLAAQMRQGVFTEEVAEAVKGGRYRVEIEPQSPKANHAVAFAVAFDDPNVNTAAARHALTCTWTFSHPPAPADVSPGVRAARWLRDRLRRLAAREPLRPEWQTWTEKGLTVSHYFPTAGTFDVTVEFRDPRGEVLASTPGRTKTIMVEPEQLGWFGERTKIEYSRLAIILVVTVAGLLVGARDELAKLDLIPGVIAVFMLGFGADQIKNVLAPPASQ